MSLRSVVAGPSRLTSIPVRPTSTRRVSLPRRHLTIPHPDLQVARGSKASNRFSLFSQHRILSMVHLFAMIRAAETALGSRVLYIDPFYDTTALRYTPLVHITLAQAVEFDQRLDLSIPPPSLSPKSNHLGGPCLEDVRNAIHSSPDITQFDNSPDAIEFTIQAKSPEQWRSVQRQPGAYNNGDEKRKQELEDAAILEALEQLSKSSTESSDDAFAPLLRRYASRRTIDKLPWTRSTNSQSNSGTHSRSRRNQDTDGAGAENSDYEKFLTQFKTSAIQESRRRGILVAVEPDNKQDDWRFVIGGSEASEERSPASASTSNKDQATIGSDSTKPVDFSDSTSQPELAKRSFSIRDHAPTPTSTPSTSPIPQSETKSEPGSRTKAQLDEPEAKRAANKAATAAKAEKRRSRKAQENVDREAEKRPSIAEVRARALAELET